MATNTENGVDEQKKTTLHAAFSSLRTGQYFAAGYEGKCHIVCQVTGRVRGKIRARVANGGWGIGFHLATMVAKPFGSFKQHYEVMNTLQLPPDLEEQVVLADTNGFAYEDALAWWQKNVPNYLPPVIKLYATPNPSEKLMTFQLDGSQTLKFHAIHRGKERSGTTDAELIRVLLERMPLHDTTLQNRYSKVLRQMALDLEPKATLL